MKRQLIALFLIAVMAVSVLTAVGVTTTQKAEAAIPTWIRQYGLNEVNVNAHYSIYAVSGCLLYRYFKRYPDGVVRPTWRGLPNKWVALYVRDCSATSCTAWRLWTTVRTGSTGQFFSPARGINRGLYCWTKARFFGVAGYGSCQSSLLRTDFGPPLQSQLVTH